MGKYIISGSDEKNLVYIWDKDSDYKPMFSLRKTKSKTDGGRKKLQSYETLKTSHGAKCEVTVAIFALPRLLLYMNRERQQHGIEKRDANYVVVTADKLGKIKVIVNYET